MNDNEILGKPRLVDERKRVRLPSQVMDLLELNPGDEVFFKIKDNRIVFGKTFVKREFFDIVNK